MDRFQIGVHFLALTAFQSGLGSYDVAVMIAVFTFLTLRLLTLIKEENGLRDGGKSDRKPDTRLD